MNDKLLLALALNKKNNNSGGVISYNDLIDKPFGESEICIAPEQALVFQKNEGAPAPIAILTGDIKEVVEGTTCVVKWGTEIYESTVVNAGSTLAIGNTGLLFGGESTGEPFIISYMYENDILMGLGVMLVGEPADTVSITGKVIQTLDPKYLPSGGGGGGKLYVDLHITSLETVTCNVPIEEILQALEEGKEVVGRGKLLNSDEVYFTPLRGYGTADSSMGANCYFEGFFTVYGQLVYGVISVEPSGASFKAMVLQAEEFSM